MLLLISKETPFIESENKNEIDSKSTRSKTVPRAPPSSYNVDIYRIKCVVCGLMKPDNDYN